MSNLTERTCAACGAAAHSWTLLDRGVKVWLCKVCFDREDVDEAVRARRAAQPKEVDPRTLPVGAVFRTDKNKAQTFRVTVAGKTCENVDGGRAYDYDATLPFKAIVISLPPAEVELGTLSVGERCKAPATRVMRVTRPSDCAGLVTMVIDDGSEFHGAMSQWRKTERVIRVPPPTSAGSDTLSEAHKSTGSRMHTGAAAAELPTDSGPSAGKSEPAVSRWPNTPAEHHPRLDAQLAQQVASGGQSCKAAWSLIERADRVRREADERERSREQYLRRSDEAYGHHRDEAIHNGLERERIENGFYVAQSGIASLRLERTLIAWKRRK